MDPTVTCSPRPCCARNSSGRWAGRRGLHLEGVSQKPRRPLILIVDDAKLIREMGRDAFEAAGFEVAEAEDGEEGLCLFRELGPDLVLLDVEMPKVDGYTVCEEIRQSEHGSQTPVLMMTGLDDVDSIRLAYEVGATDFASKPVSWVIICHLLSTWRSNPARVVTLKGRS